MYQYIQPQRNDMVEYFGEQLWGFCFTQNGWVQSYGSRCVKPPVLFGDISRPAPMTVEWTRYAQSLTDKPMKGMLTGPVTMLMWSFTREDISREQQAQQLALAHAASVKKADMADPAAAQRATGYLVGGISPLGQKKRLRTFIDSSAQALPSIFVSAGRRGLEVELAPEVLAEHTAGSFASIGRG